MIIIYYDLVFVHTNDLTKYKISLFSDFLHFWQEFQLVPMLIFIQNKFQYKGNGMEQ